MFTKILVEQYLSEVTFDARSFDFYTTTLFVCL